MIYIINGKNAFLKESTVASLRKQLDESYELLDVIIEKSDKPNEVQMKLEDLLIKLSMNGFFSSEFCGFVSLPESAKQKNKKKEKKSEDNLLINLIKLSASYCSEEKQLIIYTPKTLSPDERKEITDICNGLYHEFIDLKYVSSNTEIFSFCSDLITKFGIKFSTDNDKNEFISSITTSAQCITNTKGDLEDITMFTKAKDIVYDQHLLYSIIHTIYCYGIDAPPLTFAEIEDLLISIQLKQPLHILLGKIFKCKSKMEVQSAVTEVFDLLTKSEISSFLTYFKGCLFDFIKVTNGESGSTRRSKIISNSNLKLKCPEDLYNELDTLSKDKRFPPDSCRNDITLFLLEQL